jgi:hypothetical protein
MEAAALQSAGSAACSVLIPVFISMAVVTYLHPDVFGYPKRDPPQQEVLICELDLVLILNTVQRMGWVLVA